MSTTRKVAAWKKEAIAQLQELLEKYPVIAAADLTKVRSSQIHELRKRLRDRVAMVVTKNNLLRKSVELSESSHGRVGEFVKDLQGSNILLFTDVNPYSLNHIARKEQGQSSRESRRYCNWRNNGSSRKHRTAPRPGNQRNSERSRSRQESRAEASGVATRLGGR